MATTDVATVGNAPAGGMMTGLGGPHVTNTTAKVEDRWGIQIYIQGAAGERHRLQGHESRAPGSRGGGPCGRDQQIASGKLPL